MASLKEINCSAAAVRVKGAFPFNWDLNAYRGCGHGCKYCYALYSHDYIDKRGSYFENIYVKSNVAEKLEEQLQRTSWKKEIINLGGVTDSYQPFEKEYKIMPEILRIMIKYKNPVIISTKSELILRDFELFEELSKSAFVCIAATVTCADENMRSKLEPGAAKSSDRFKMIKEFSKAGIHTGIHFMPAIPFLTDNKENINGVFERAAECGADYAVYGMLNLRGKTKGYFTEFMKKEFPEKMDLFVKYFVDKNYRDAHRAMVYGNIDSAMKKYGVSKDYPEGMMRKGYREAEQTSLFD